MKEKYYTTQETAQELGVTVRQVYRMLDDNKIKSVKRGKKHFFLESDIDKLMKEGW